MDFKSEAKRQLEILKKNAIDIIPEENFLHKLEYSLRENAPLKVKAGFDPTAPDIHLGHCVLLKKLRTFQDLGHIVCFIVGDFTARVGDPTGKSEMRPPLSEAQVIENARTYTEQAFKVLDKSKTEIIFNGNWFDQMSLKDMTDVLRCHTVARMLERDDFEKRMNANKPISMLEFIYPLLQGYDSVKLEADIEIGGSDQRFNLLVGRHLQEAFNQTPQVIMTLPLLVGLDGVQKMSKSLNNYIGVAEEPSQIFGKVMSLSDDLMYHYYEIFTDESIKELKQNHPKEVKMSLGEFFVTMFYDSDQAKLAREGFEQIFSKGNLENQDFDEYIVPVEGEAILDVIVNSGKLSSRNDARRMIKQGAVKFDGEKLADDNLILSTAGILKIGKKKFLKIVAS